MRTIGEWRRVFERKLTRSRERQPFLVILQSDLVSRNLDTVVVAPLEAASGGKFADRLNPGRYNRRPVIRIDRPGTRGRTQEHTWCATRLNRSRARSHYRGARPVVHWGSDGHLLKGRAYRRPPSAINRAVAVSISS
jgi:hypothetical protein